DSAVHVSRSCKERITRVTAARQDFLEKHGREATISELAQLLRLDESQVVLALEANQRPLSLQTPLDADAGDRGSLADILPSDESEEGWVSALLLREGMVRLPARLRFILEARYFREQTQSEIAACLGVSQVQVSRLEKQALRLLREYWQPEQRA
ncbi:MAG: RNA polymerase sigma-G factor, partial [Firmicutes bacterium]|nr:RNA polymerase sigma-G factor [Bacillota bacterium]